jgi:hypothetical protein
LGALAALLLTACASTQKTAEWRDPSYAGQKFDDILVIGVSEKATVRRMFESNLVDELTKKQLTAIPSFSIMAADEKISKEAIKAAIAGKNIDAVLVTLLVGVEQKEAYQPPMYSPGFGYYGHYSAAYTRVYQPGYYQRYDVVKLETTLYDVKTEKPVWSMQSDTIDPEVDEKLIKSAINAVIKALSEQALI